MDKLLYERCERCRRGENVATDCKRDDVYCKLTCSDENCSFTIHTDCPEMYYKSPCPSCNRGSLTKCEPVHLGYYDRCDDLNKKG